MVNMKCSPNLSFCSSTSLACVPVAASGALRLSFPVWTIVWIKSAAPCWVIRSCHSCLMSNLKAFSTTVLILVALDLIRLTFNRCGACGTRDFYFTGYADKIIGTLPSTGAFAGTKISVLNRAKMLLRFLAAPSTRYFHPAFCAFNRAVKMFGGFKSVWLNFKNLAAYFTGLFDLRRLRRMGALIAAILLFGRDARLKHCNLSALQACKLSENFGSTKFIRSQFVGAFTTTSCALAGIKSAFIRLVSSTAYWANIIYLHRCIIAQMSLCAKSGSEAIGAAKAGWRNITGIELDAEYCEINRRRFDYWAEQAQTVQPALLEVA